MVKLFRHLWDQFVNDEDSAKIWLSSAKTALLVLGVQVGVATGGALADCFAWGWKQWAATALATMIAAGAKAAAPVTKE